MIISLSFCQINILGHIMKGSQMSYDTIRPGYVKGKNSVPGAKLSVVPKLYRGFITAAFTVIGLYAAFVAVTATINYWALPLVMVCYFIVSYNRAK